jgi:hypothetical protein
MTTEVIGLPNPVQEIVVDFTYETENEDGDKTIHAYSIDGRILLITKPNPTKLARLVEAETMLKRPDETLQQKNHRDSAGDLTDPREAIVI